MKNLTENVLYYEQLGEDFDRFISDYDTARRVLMLKRLLAQSGLGRHAAVFEVGCGTGRITAEFRPKFERYTVNDISEVLTRKVAQKHRCETLLGDVTLMSDENEHFDLVISSEVLEHTPDPREHFTGLVRRLKPGGYLMLTTPNRLWYPLLVIARALGLRKFQGIENWVWPSTLKVWTEQERLRLCKMTGCHLFPWQVPGAKLLLPALDNLGDQLYPLMINVGLLVRRETDREY